MSAVQSDMPPAEPRALEAIRVAPEPPAPTPRPLPRPGPEPRERSGPRPRFGAEH